MSGSIKKEYNSAKAHSTPGKSRWAAANRKKRMKRVRISPQQLEKIDQVSGEGQRSEWLVTQFENFLKLENNPVPEEYPDYRASKSINISMSFDLENRIHKAAEASGIKPTPWMLRVANWGLEQNSPATDNDLVL